MQVFDAVRSGDVARVRDLVVEDPAQISSTDENGDSPLHVAAWTRQTEVARLLLDLGGDPNTMNRENRTALHNAFEAGSGEIDSLLRERGAIVDISLAAGYGDLERMRQLLDEDTSRVHDLSTGITPMDWAGYGNAGDAIRLLVEYGADVNFTHPDGDFTPLFPPASTGNLDSGRALLELGANPNMADHKGNTPLHTAVAMRFTIDASAFAELLLEFDADVNARNRTGLTPLGLLRKARDTDDWGHPSAPAQNRKHWDRMEMVLTEHGATE